MAKEEKINNDETIKIKDDYVFQGTPTTYMGFQIFLAIPTNANVNPKQVALMFDKTYAEMIHKANQASIIPTLMSSVARPNKH